VDIGAGQGHFVLTAVTRSRHRAVVGNSVSLELSAVVTGLHIRRQWDTVRVGWLWPDGVHEARVSWTTATEGGNLSCSRRAFLDEGGVRLELGPQAATIAVRTVVRQRHTEVLSAPAIGEIPARPPRVTWLLEREGWPRRRSMLELSADQSCAVPQLVLAIPGGGAGGPELGCLAPRWIAAGRDHRTDVTDIVPPALVDEVICTFADPATAAVTLVRKTSGR
jgi:hypothetical protein